MAEEVAEVVSRAEQPDFLKARPEYVVRIVRDSPSWITIAYRNKDREKKIKVSNYVSGDEAAKLIVPPSVLQLIKWEYGS